MKASSKGRLAPKVLEGDDFGDEMHEGYRDTQLSDLSRSEMSIRNLVESEPNKAIDQIAIKYAEKKREIEKLETALSSV